MDSIVEESRKNDSNIKSLLHEKEKAIALLTENESINKEAIASLSDQLDKLMEEIDTLKKDKGENGTLSGSKSETTNHTGSDSPVLGKRLSLLLGNIHIIFC
jgi:hypothetical protein